jgi:hypothetical protein
MLVESSNVKINKDESSPGVMSGGTHYAFAIQSSTMSTSLLAVSDPKAQNSLLANYKYTHWVDSWEEEKASTIL